MTLFVFVIDIEPNDAMKSRFGKMLSGPDLAFAKASLERRIVGGINLGACEYIKIVSVRKK